MPSIMAAKEWGLSISFLLATSFTKLLGCRRHWSDVDLMIGVWLCLSSFRKWLVLLRTILY